MMRVSTSSMSNMLIRQIADSQVKLNSATVQSSTGKVSETYSGNASNTVAIAGLEADLARSVATTERGETHSNTVDAMYDAVGSLIDLVQDFRADISSALAGDDDATDTGIATSASTVLDSFVATVNMQYGDRYVFSGAATDQAPIDLDSYTAQTYPSSSDTSYYQGSGDLAGFYVSDSQTIDYSFTADDSAIEQALRAFSLVQNASLDPVDTDALNEAYDLLDQAAEGLALAQTNLSLSANAIDSALDHETDYQLTLESSISSLTDVDITEALVELETLQTQLEASYSATSKIYSMSLFDYLK